MHCGEYTDVVRLSATTGEVDWRTALSRTETDRGERGAVRVVKVGHGVALVRFVSGASSGSPDDLFIVDFETGSVDAHVDLGEDFAFPPPWIEMVPGGFCALSPGAASRSVATTFPGGPGGTATTSRSTCATSGRSSCSPTRPCWW